MPAASAANSPRLEIILIDIAAPPGPLRASRLEPSLPQLLTAADALSLHCQNRPEMNSPAYLLDANA